jgi:hypothetical protein
LPALPFFEVSTGSDPVLSGGRIFLHTAIGFGHGGQGTFISSKTQLMRPWCFKIFWGSFPLLVSIVANHLNHFLFNINNIFSLVFPLGRLTLNLGLRIS